jgi:hypothetical protein
MQTHPVPYKSPWVQTIKKVDVHGRPTGVAMLEKGNENHCPVRDTLWVAKTTTIHNVPSGRLVRCFFRLAFFCTAEAP